jgi:hypothetical protein
LIRNSVRCLGKHQNGAAQCSDEPDATKKISPKGVPAPFFRRSGDYRVTNALETNYTRAGFALLNAIDWPPRALTNAISEKT